MYLLRGCDALLLVELGALFGFDVKAEAFLEGLLFEHEGGAEPQIVRLAEVLEHARPDWDRRNTLRHGFHKAVERTGLAVSLSLVTAAAQERAHLPRQGLQQGRGAQGHVQYS